MSSRKETRVLVLAPTKRDADLTCTILRGRDIDCIACRDVHELMGEIKQGVGAVLLAEEVVATAKFALLVEVIAQQPPWSDIPVLFITGQGADSAAVAFALESLGNVTLIERPTRVPALVSAVQTALKARLRQYQARNYTEALKQADRRKDEFLAMLGHELRNPLAAIKGGVQLLESEKVKLATKQEMIPIVADQVAYMERLIDDVLDVARIAEGKIRIELRPTALQDVVRQAIELVREARTSKRCNLRLSQPDSPLVLNADPVRLAQVISNLLTNSIKFSADGYQIDLNVYADNGEATIEVRDYGIGITADLLPDIFDLFVQERRSLDRSEGGLGLGLTVVKMLVEKHGGRVEAFSEGEGKGSTFRIRLPLAIPGS